MAKILIRSTLYKYKRGVSVVDIKLRARAFFLWSHHVKGARAFILWWYPLYMNPDCFNYCQAPCARPESFPGYGSYRLWRTRSVLEMLFEMLPESSTSADEGDAIAREEHHVILVPWFGTTSLVQINDIDIHEALRSIYIYIYIYANGARVVREWADATQPRTRYVGSFCTCGWDHRLACP